MLTISGSIIFPVFTICAARLPVLQSSSAPVIIVILFEGMFIFSCLKTKKVKMIHYERHAYYLHEKSFTNGYRFMRIELEEGVTVHKIDWQSLVSVLESPVVKSIRL